MFFWGGNVCFLYIAKLFVRRHSSYLGVVAPWERRDGGGTWERSDDEIKLVRHTFFSPLDQLEDQNHQINLLHCIYADLRLLTSLEV